MAHRGNMPLLNSLVNSISQDVYKDILSNLNEAHKSAWAQIGEQFSPPVAKDLVPHHRRAIFEDKMTMIARRHNLSNRSVLNEARNASHVEIEVCLNDSKKVVLTALAVQDAHDFRRLRAAQFRTTHAQQGCLFKEYEHDGDAYYGVILHGAHPENRNSLDFAYLAFPYADCKGWFGRYDLRLLAGNSLTDLEIVEDKVDPKLRSEAIRKAE